MARKTRKEKMAAQLRRLKNEATRKQDINEQQSKPVKYKFKPDQKIDISRPQKIYTYSFIYSDLKKISVLVVATLLFQVGMNLTLRTDFAKLLLLSLGIEI